MENIISQSEVFTYFWPDFYSIYKINLLCFDYFIKLIFFKLEKITYFFSEDIPLFVFEKSRSVY